MFVVFDGRISVKNELKHMVPIKVLCLQDAFKCKRIESSKNIFQEFHVQNDIKK